MKESSLSGAAEDVTGAEWEQRFLYTSANGAEIYGVIVPEIGCVQVGSRTSAESILMAVAHLQEQIKELTDWQRDVQEREAACCPEDVGFDEYIARLEKPYSGIKEPSPAGDDQTQKALREGVPSPEDLTA